MVYNKQREIVSFLKKTEGKNVRMIINSELKEI